MAIAWVLTVSMPSATYRLQFNSQFRFSDAAAVLEYLHDLGITHLYSSPLFKARRGTPHGYDVTDPTEINPEIGTRAEFDRFSEWLRQKQLKLLLDFVPNHLAASVENPWWSDVLANGSASPYAQFFDIDWNAGKLMLPILAKPYGECLESGDFSIGRNNGGETLRYFDHELPLRVERRGLTAASALSGADELDTLLSEQPYRLAYWRKAAESLNYRRFFDVNDLVGVKIERDEVFAEMHRTAFELLRLGQIHGLRIDHIDGLRDPKMYLERLPETYTVVEKILGSSEDLPGDWKTHGTTGYDFLNIVNCAFIDGPGFRELRRIYVEFTGLTDTADETFRKRKRQVMDDLFFGELHSHANRLFELAQSHRSARDLTHTALRDAVVAVTSCLPVYRTYIRSEFVSDRDRRYIEHALQQAAASSSAEALDFLRQVLLIEPPYYMEDRRSELLDFVLRWQQFTGPVMAKGVEDTTFFVHNPLIAVNEVGGDLSIPEPRFGIDEFHRRMRARQERWPATMNASSTHDTKRSEDVRARINVLSEIAEEWEDCLERWSRWNPSDSAPDRNEQVFIYQTVLGAWPIPKGRLHPYLIKALREAKTHTSWLRPDHAYEEKVLQFVDRLFENAGATRFMRNFLKFQQKIAYFGALNSLSQSLLKITCPGIPDIYQGTELWDLSLGDPDNRRPVDFASRIATLEWLKHHAKPGEMLRHWRDGRIKQFVIWKALNFRRDHPALFSFGDYLPVEVEGACAENVIAFVRRYRGEWALIIVPRLVTQITRQGKPPLGARVWKDTRLQLPDGSPQIWKNEFTTTEWPANPLLVSLLTELPFALLSGAAE